MQKSPFEWMILPLQRYADFRGRTQRAEFWWWTLLYYLITIVLLAIMFSGFPWETMVAGNVDAAKFNTGSEPSLGFGAGLWIGGGLYAVFALGTIVPNLAVTVRRLHDRGMSGWWYGGLMIANLIPVVNILTFFGFIALLIVCVLPGQAGPNRWGPDPLDPSQASVFE